MVTPKKPWEPDLINMLMACARSCEGPVSTYKPFEDTTAILAAADCAEEYGYTNLTTFLRWLGRQIPELLHGQLLQVGSRVYGVPRPDSDVDWVIYTGQDVGNPKMLYDWLLQIADRKDSIKFATVEDYRGNTYEDYEKKKDQLDGAFRLGPLNLIVVSNIKQWMSWYDGVSLLRQEAFEKGGGLPKERACEVFEGLAQQYAQQRISIRYGAHRNSKFKLHEVVWTNLVYRYEINEGTGGVKTRYIQAY